MDSLFRMIRSWNKSTKPTHVAIYHSAEIHEGKTHHQFRFVLGQQGTFRTDVPHGDSTGTRLVRVRIEAIPEEFVDAVQQYVRQRGSFAAVPEDAFHRYLGHLGIVHDKSIAETRSVYPRSEMKDKLALEFGKQTPGWGAHLEAICARHLEKKGIGQIKSGPFASDARNQVLQRAGLPRNHPAPIREWYTKLEAYFQNQLEQYRRKVKPLHRSA